MVRINLLPTKKAARLGTLRNEFFTMVAIVVCALVLIIVWDQSISSELDDLNGRMANLNVEIDRLSREVKEIDKLKGKQKKIEEKLKVIGNLEKKRYGPARMLDELGTILDSESKRVWFTQLRQEGQTLTLQGSAMDHEDVSEFQTSLERRPMFQNVVLKKVTAKKDGNLSILNWQISCTVKYGSGA